MAGRARGGRSADARAAAAPAAAAMPPASTARRFDAVVPPLSATTLAAVASAGFTAMTPVQQAVIPLFLGNKDVAVEACTGSGKTVAFVIPLVERLLRVREAAAELPRGTVLAIIVSPTRELARQIHGVVTTFMQGTPLHAMLLTGGTDARADLSRCVAEGCDVVVATPGRLLDVMTRAADAASGGSSSGGSSSGGGAVSFNRVEVLVLDEADTLLDMGFAEALTTILTHLPKQRRTGLFSATQTREVTALARAGMRNPIFVKVALQTADDDGKLAPKDSGAATAAAAAASADGGDGDGDGGGGDAFAAASAATRSTHATPLTLTNHYRMCGDQWEKLVTLLAFLAARARSGDKAIVFMLTCASVDYYGRVLADDALRSAAGLPPAATYPIMPLHGQMPPGRRTRSYEAFVKADTAVLLCTDVAARGIDVPDVDWIVQYDPPKDPAFFIHRVGRTARAGRSGQSLLLLLQKERRYLELLAVKGVPISELDEAELARPEPGAGAGSASAAAVAADMEAVRRRMLAVATEDRDVLLKSTKAFVSFIRGYCEHVLRLVFKMEQLDIAALAASFGVVKLPKVDELRGKKIDYAGLPGVNTGAIAFASAEREKARQAKLAVEAEATAQRISARNERRDHALALAGGGSYMRDDGTVFTTSVGGKRKRSHKSVSARIADDWDALQAEERLERRYQKGKIDKATYARELAALLHKEEAVAVGAGARADAGAGRGHSVTSELLATLVPKTKPALRGAIGAARVAHGSDDEATEGVDDDGEGGGDGDAGETGDAGDAAGTDDDRDGGGGVDDSDEAAAAPPSRKRRRVDSAADVGSATPAEGERRRNSSGPTAPALRGGRPPIADATSDLAAPPLTAVAGGSLRALMSAAATGGMSGRSASGGGGGAAAELLRRQLGAYRSRQMLKRGGR